MDAITLLKDDHKTVEKLFKRFEKAGDAAYKEKANVAEKIREELSRHAAVEEQLFYPVVRATVDDVEDITLESLEEHHIVKWVLSELDDMDPKDERFTAKMTVLIENVRHHVEEEEDDLFPKVRAGLGRKDLAELGDAMEAARRVAPTHPHPRAPDTPPGNIAAGAVAGVTDRVGDGVKGAAQGAVATAQGAVSGAQDLIGRILGSRSNGSGNRSNGSANRSARATAGSASASAKRTAKRTASTTRKATGGAARKAASTTRAASGTAKKASGTAKKATGSAKKAAGSAKKSAGRTAKKAGSTAKKAAGTTRTTARKTASTAKTTAKRSAAARR